MEELKEAIRNAADKAAKARTIEEAERWQGIINNLASALRLVNEDK